MKKVLLIILALILVLAFTAGCGNTNDSNAKEVGDIGAAVEDNAANDEESFKGTAVGSNLDAIDTEGLTLDDLNTLDEDSEGSFRSGARVPIEDMETASGN